MSAKKEKHFLPADRFSFSAGIIGQVQTEIPIKPNDGLENVPVHEINRFAPVSGGRHRGD